MWHICLSQYEYVAYFYITISICCVFVHPNINMWSICPSQYYYVAYLLIAIWICGVFLYHNINMWCICPSQYQYVAYLSIPISLCGVFVNRNMIMWCIFLSQYQYVVYLDIPICLCGGICLSQYQWTSETNLNRDCDWYCKIYFEIYFDKDCDKLAIIVTDNNVMQKTMKDMLTGDNDKACHRYYGRSIDTCSDTNHSWIYLPDADDPRLGGRHHRRQWGDWKPSNSVSIVLVIWIVGSKYMRIIVIGKRPNISKTT